MQDSHIPDSLITFGIITTFRTECRKVDVAEVVVIIDAVKNRVIDVVIGLRLS